MARGNKKQQNARYPRDYTPEQQKTVCHTCGKYHRAPCRFANGNQAPGNSPSNQQVAPCHVCDKRHRGSCRWLPDFDRTKGRSQSSNMTKPQDKVYCLGCNRRRHAGPCRDVIKGRLATGGCVVVLPLRVAAVKVRQHGGPERVDYFIREVGSEDALMCYCDGTTSSFCVKHYAEQVGQQPQNNHLVITQSDMAGLQQSMWSNHFPYAYDELVAAPSDGRPLTGNVNHTVNAFRSEQSPDENEDMEMLYL